MRGATRLTILACVLVLIGGGGLGLSPFPSATATGRLVAATPAATPASAASVEMAGLVERPGPLSLDELRRLPVQTVDATYETNAGSEQHQFTGVRLYDVLQHVGVVAEPDDRTPLLRRYVIVSAKDGYRVVLSGGEIDPAFGNAPLLLAWARDGQPLSGEEGPLELVAPGDRPVSRYVWGVVSIEVLGIESAPEAGG